MWYPERDMDLQQESGRRELGRRIQSAIVQAGYDSLPVFAEALGCSRALIYQYVAGDVLVQLDRLSRIAQLTDRPLDWFLAEDPNGGAAEMRRLHARMQEVRERCERLEAGIANERGARMNEAEQGRHALLQALQDLCRAQRRCGDMAGLLRTAARCRDLAVAVDDDVAVMRADLSTGHAAFGLGDRESAEEALQSALDLAKTRADTRIEQSARQELVRVWQAAGHIERAREQAEELTGAQRWWPRWAGLVALAAIEEQAGRLGEAADLLDRAEAVIAEEGAPAEHAKIAQTYLMSNRVNLALARGCYVEADEDGERLHALAAEAGLADQVREATLNRAICAMRTGNMARACDLLDRLRDWAEMASDQRMRGLAAVFEAERLVRAGEPAKARRLAMDAIEMGNGAVNGHVVAEAELVLGMACREDGLFDDAAYYLRRCRDRAARLRLCRIEVAATLQQALMMVGQDDRGARAALHKVAEAALAHGYEDIREQAVGVLSSLPGAAAEEDSS
jgi:tetratricopeptide (TPR) repeat protein